MLATHEQAWLFAGGRHLLPPDAPIAVAPIEAFDRVQGKAEFAVLLDELDVPQPRWWRCDERPAQAPYPHWVKASYGTAGRAVRRVETTEQERQAIRELSGAGVVMGQAPAAGQYGQVQALFDRGRLAFAARQPVSYTASAELLDAAVLGSGQLDMAEHDLSITD